MLGWLQTLGRSGIGFFEQVGHAHMFMLQALKGIPYCLRKPYLLTAQVYSVGVLSMPIILIPG
jgi:phospholipid/cholesterol/gamma-HCH transport system permease protein